MAARALVMAASSASTLAPDTLRSSSWPRVQPATAASAGGDVRRVGQAGRGVDGRPGHLGPHQHVGAHVLDRLEAPDRLAELLALLGVGHGQVEHRRRVTHLERGGEQRAVAPEAAAVVGQGAAEGQRVEPPHRGERVQRAGPVGGRRRWAPGPAAGAAPSAPRTSSASRDAQVLDQDRAGPSRAERADLDPPVGRPVDRAGHRGEERADQRPGHERPAELFEDDAGVGQSQAGAGRLGQGEGEDPGLAQGGPVLRLGHARRALAGPHALEGQPSGHHRTDALGQLALVVADAEVHQRAPWAGRGCVRPRCCAAPARCPPRW